MSESKRSRFQFRALVSVLTTVSFVTLATSGIILFITPPGRIAHWTGWRFWGLTKSQWSSVHIWFALLFAVAAGVHIYYNWRPLLNYFKSRLTKKLSFRFEWLIALGLCVVVFAGTLAQVPPFSSLIAWDEEIKLSWAQEEADAPIPHAELLSLAELATEVKMDVQALIQNLQKHNITEATPETIVGELAETHNMTPQQLYKIAVGPRISSRSGHQMGAGMGLGKLTLNEFCQQENLELDVALQKLQAADIDAQPGMKIRDIAINNNRKPYEILDIIR